MDAKLKQTLNLAKGGQGDPAVVWAGIEAKRRRIFSKFKAAMEAYVEEHGSALVPKAYVDDDGYPLGQKLNDFRHGVMRKGMSDQTHIEAWAEALPKWAWNARETDEWREGRTQRLKDMWKNESAEAKAKRIAKFRATLATDASKAKRSKISKDRFANESAEAKADRIAKTRAAMATDASKAKQVQAAKDRMATERRAELERARPIAVPFVKSHKRRKELRAASTNFSGRRGNAVLYMISEDGKTIRSVQKSGAMTEDTIVGPVVDPASPDAFDSDSDWVL